MASRETQVAFGVLGAGALGGVASLLFAVVTGQLVGRAIDIAAVILLATGAAAIGVYVIGNSDRRDVMRCLSFAFLCGFAWRPVYEGGTVYVKTLAQQSGALKSAEQATSAAQQLAADTSGNPMSTPARVAAVTDAAVKAVNALPVAATDAARAEVAQATQTALSAVTRAGGTHPTVTSQALARIGLSAADNGDSVGARQALRALDSLQTTIHPAVGPIRAVMVENRRTMSAALLRATGR